MAEFKRLDKEFAYDLMAVPTYSGMEERIRTYILLFADKNNIDYEFDNYGNLYLTKGKLEEGEYYPCMTAHIDSVQTEHKKYIVSGENLEVLTEEKDGKTILKGNGYGLGADDKCGILIALSMFKYVDKMKASFFLEEENGCRGSNQMNVSFYDNVGYVIGFDSPDFNRSAWSCSGVQLFSKNFYEDYMKEICDSHGRTLFYTEPFTDIEKIRENVSVQCMNFGSGYYNAHTNTEYLVLEEVDDCIGLAFDLITKLGNKLYFLQKGLGNSEFGKYDYKTRTYSDVPNKEDIKFLKTLGDNNRYKSSNSYGYYNRRYNGFYDDYDYDDYYNYYNGYDYNGVKSKNKDVDDTQANITDLMAISYVMEKYDERLEQLKEDMKARCESIGVDFESNFADLFDEEITF